MQENSPEHFEQNASPEREPQPRRVFIEIGPASQPVTWLGSREFGENETYVAIDANPDAIREAKELTDLDQPDREHVHFIRADAQELPLKDATADEVFLGNVLGDWKILPEAKDKFIEEAKRILKENGTIVIKETSSPVERRAFTEFLQKHGLFVEREYDERSPEWREKVKPYDWVDAGERRPEHPFTGKFLAFLKPG